MEKQVIQSVGFRNIKDENGNVTGFQFKVRLPYYRGIFLSQIRPGTLYIDGEKIEKDDIVWNIKGEDFTNDVENKLLYMQIKDYLDELNIDDAARQIFNMRYGLDNEKTYTYNEIGKEFDISMAGIKKIESEILNMLQANIIHGSNKQKEKHYKVKILKHG